MGYKEHQIQLKASLTIRQDHLTRSPKFFLEEEGQKGNSKAHSLRAQHSNQGPRDFPFSHSKISAAFSVLARSPLGVARWLLQLRAWHMDRTKVGGASGKCPLHPLSCDMRNTLPQKHLCGFLPLLHCPELGHVPALKLIPGISYGPPRGCAGPSSLRKMTTWYLNNIRVC